jgi:TatD DNase family protein
MKLVDSHCHLNYEDFGEEQGAIVQRAVANGVQTMLSICTDLAEAETVTSLTATYANVYASVGIHPDHCTPDNIFINDQLTASLVAWAQRCPKVLGFGETGLDYYRTTEHSALQQQSFRAHMVAALHCDKPVIVHSRAADDDTVKLLKEHPGVKAVIHCFTGSADMARACLDLGAYISISGIVTFKNARELQDIVRWLPLDRLLIETDSPFLAPVPHRGKRNEPAYVTHVAEYISHLKSVPLRMIAEATTNNFNELFHPPIY